MSAASYLLGLDISTTAAKALLIDSAGQVAGVASTPTLGVQPATALVGAGPGATGGRA